METIRICQLAGFYGYGGVSRVAINLAHGLTKVKEGKYEVTYLCRRAEMKKDPDHEFMIVELKPKNTLDLWKKLETYGDFDLIHNHDIYALPGFKRRKRIKTDAFVFTMHGIVPNRFNRIGDLPGIYFAKRCGQRGIRYMDMNVAISRYISNELRDVYGTKKIMQIPNPIDTIKMQNLLDNDKEEFENNKGHPELICVSILERQKGQQFLINAMKDIRREFPEATLTIIGKGRDEDLLRDRIKQLNLNEYVNLLGYQPDSVLYQYYNHSDIAIVPSYWESFGIPIIEAMSFGKPVITRNAYSMNEHINDSKAGALFEKDDPSELIDALKQVMNNYDNYSRSALKYSKQFHLNKIIDKHSELYHTLINLSN